MQAETAVKWLRQVAEDIRAEGHAGWGNTLDDVCAMLEGKVLCDAEPVAWLSMATSPPPFWFSEWFIAKLDNGDRVVLRWLPKENSYDFTTADETYYKLYRVTHWMQFPDSQYFPLYAPADIGKEGA